MGTTVVLGDIEWDSDKDAANIAKHGVSFAVASTVFVDIDAVFADDDAMGENRMTVVGVSISGVLFVVFVERGERDRIISARKATTIELALYRARR